jgi:hypothetical protein
LALGGDEQALLMGLDGKWRNCLRKGLRLGVKVTIARGIDGELELMIKRYAALQRERGFRGISEALLRCLAGQQGPAWQFDLFIARAEKEPNSKEPLGVLVSVRHGDTTTYIVGATNEEGRRMQANSVLLWQAILHAKQAGCAWFDVGGLDATTPKGIAEFKRGLNATPYALVGEWHGWVLPWNSGSSTRTTVERSESV